MQLSEQEKAANRAAFRAMSLGQKADYIYSYYKLPLVIALVVIVALGSVAHKALTHKDAILYVGFVNVVPPSEVDTSLTSEFVSEQGKDPHREEVLAYRELYLSSATTASDQKYAYASRLKLMAAIDAKQLDVVLMDDDALGILAEANYLLELKDGQRAVDVTDSHLLGHFSGGEHLYLGIVANTPRLDLAQTYLGYVAR